MIRNRTWASCLAIFAMLFAQLAVAAYSCPGLSLQQGAVVAAEPASPCEDMQAGLANLCQKHCHDDEQSQGISAAVVGFVPGFVVQLHLPTGSAPVSLASPPALYHATAPPLTIRNCCFRI